jgi:hypothetical protein
MLMNNGPIRIAVAVGLLLFCAAAFAAIYKIVDEQGNVTYTDQAPSDGSEPMKLPELPVVQTVPVEPAPGPGTAEGEGEPAGQEPTPRELRRMYRDFRVTRPAQEETFWGTGNTVVVSWASSMPLLPDMSVQLFVDGEPQRVTQETMIALTLDRGEHRVHAELRDARGRRLVTTEPVTFFVKQQSEQFNRQQPGPGSGK